MDGTISNIDVIMQSNLVQWALGIVCKPVYRGIGGALEFKTVGSARQRDGVFE